MRDKKKGEECRVNGFKMKERCVCACACVRVGLGARFGESQLRGGPIWFIHYDSKQPESQTVTIHFTLYDISALER